MLARSLYKTFRSPNQRTTTQGWEGKKPPKGGFLLADKYSMIKFFPHKTIKDHVAVFTGDTCNLACVLCGPDVSTRWQYELGQQQSRHMSIEPVIEKFNFEPYNSVLFTGGEPILNPATLQILKKLNSQTHVVMHMNGTVLPNQELLDECKKFNTINFIFSIDDVKDQFEFLRYPAKWDQVQDNIFKIKDCVSKNVLIGVLTVVSILNQDTYSRVGEWVRANLPPDTPWNTQDSNRTLCRHTYKKRIQEYVAYLDGLNQKRKTDWRILFPEASKLLQY